jgi:hypothetical protein
MRTIRNASDMNSVGVATSNSNSLDEGDSTISNNNLRRRLNNNNNSNNMLVAVRHCHCFQETYPDVYCPVDATDSCLRPFLNADGTSRHDQPACVRSDDATRAESLQPLFTIAVTVIPLLLLALIFSERGRYCRQYVAAPLRICHSRITTRGAATAADSSSNDSNNTDVPRSVETNNNQSGRAITNRDEWNEKYIIPKCSQTQLNEMLLSYAQREGLSTRETNQLLIPSADEIERRNNPPSGYLRTHIYNKPTAANEGESSSSTVDDENEIVCAICIAPLEDGDRLAILPCHHDTFHVECLKDWIPRTNACPLCKHEPLVKRQPRKKTPLHSQTIQSEASSVITHNSSIDEHHHHDAALDNRVDVPSNNEAEEQV